MIAQLPYSHRIVSSEPLAHATAKTSYVGARVVMVEDLTSHPVDLAYRSALNMCFDVSAAAAVPVTASGSEVALASAVTDADATKALVPCAATAAGVIGS